MESTSTNHLLFTFISICLCKHRLMTSRSNLFNFVDLTAKKQVCHSKDSSSTHTKRNKNYLPWHCWSENTFIIIELHTEKGRFRIQKWKRKVSETISQMPFPDAPLHNLGRYWMVKISSQQPTACHHSCATGYQSFISPTKINTSPNDVANRKDKETYLAYCYMIKRVKVQNKLKNRSREKRNSTEPPLYPQPQQVCQHGEV